LTASPPIPKYFHGIPIVRLVEIDKTCVQQI